MTVSNLEKPYNPLPLIFGLMTGGILLVGGITYFMVNRPTVESKIAQITVPVEKENFNGRNSSQWYC